MEGIRITHANQAASFQEALLHARHGRQMSLKNKLWPLAAEARGFVVSVGFDLRLWLCFALAGRQ